MMSARHAVTLLACAPSGDAAFIRDAAGVVWKALPSGVRRSSAGQAYDAVREAQFLLLNEEFEDWSALQPRVEELAAQWRAAGPDLDDFVKTYDVVAINRVLRAALRQAPAGDPRIASLARKLLFLCPCAREDEVFHRLLALAVGSARPEDVSLLAPKAPNEAAVHARRLASLPLTA
jgi:hypothetical protein